MAHKKSECGAHTEKSTGAVQSGRKAGKKENSSAHDALPLSYIDRYSRQMVIKEVGLEGQKKLKSSRVLVVGAGGLGAPVLTYLAAMGIGHIGVADSDLVEESNLNRQVLYRESSVGIPKTEEAVKALRALGSAIEYSEYPKITPENIWAVGAGYDLVLDCGDSRPLRYLLSDYSRVRGIPYVGGSSLRWEGHVYTLSSLCYRCVHKPTGFYSSGTCSSAGIIGSMCGVVGSIMATEAMKAVLGVAAGDAMLYINGLKSDFMRLQLNKKKCNVCSRLPMLTLPEAKNAVFQEFAKLEAVEAKAGACLLSDVLEKLEASAKESAPGKAAAREKTKSQGEAEESVHDRLADMSIYGQSLDPNVEVAWAGVLENPGKYFVLDMRSAAEHKILPIPRATVYALGDIIDNPKKARDYVAKKAKSRKVVLCCRNGSTSRKFIRIFGGLSIHGGAQAYIEHKRHAEAGK
ncbi:uncharacterized protein NEMAJ01_0429 [Nematocida major]|uniref:uncharacterized protein n=1 Tax=Nematocida major TaxID=1912982 RepID=UPI002008150E|nr:uncharacterized protein NEMAJ01_0429 [Nematocida major]KAH9385533.1 hypothetical protein NEMAJ01_0429 [Nematocida major]